MPGFLPTMPRFRNADGRIDWRQVADMAIPGDVWNSRTNEFRPVGAVAGAVGQFVPFGDMLVEGIYANRDRFRTPTMPNFRNPFSGLGEWLGFRTRGGDTGMGVATPESFYRDRQRMSDEAANYEYGSRTMDRTEADLAARRNQEGDMDIGTGRGGGRAGPHGVGHIGGRSPHASSAAARGVGLGIRGDSGGQAVADMTTRMHRGARGLLEA